MSSNEHRVTTYNMLLPYIITVAFVIEAFFLKDKFLEHEASHESDLSSDDDFEVNYSKFKFSDCTLTFPSEDNFKVHMSLNHDWSSLNSTVYFEMKTKFLLMKVSKEFKFKHLMST